MLSRILSLTSFCLHARRFPDGTISSDLIQSEDGEDSDLSGFSGEYKGKEGRGWGWGQGTVANELQGEAEQ